MKRCEGFDGRMIQQARVLPENGRSVREYPSLSLHGKRHPPFFLGRLVIIRQPVVRLARMAGQNRREGDGIGGLSERIYAGEVQRAVRLNGNACALRECLSVGNGELEIERGFAVLILLSI